LALATSLQSAGHDLIILGNPTFEYLAEEEGIPFVAVGKPLDLHACSTSSEMQSPFSAWQISLKWACIDSMKELFTKISEIYEPRRTCIVSPVIAFGAKVAAERYQIPLASLVISPVMIRSLLQPPKIPSMFLPSWLPTWLKAIQFKIADRFFINPVLETPLNEFRDSIGLAPVKNPTKSWWLSEQLNLGLFDSAFAPTAPDWPSNFMHVGPPLWDPGILDSEWTEVEAFLEAGSPPIVFAPGSVGPKDQTYFRAAVAACEILGRRGILLTRFKVAVPANLPANIRHFEYVPFAKLLPRCHAIVHGATMGTAMQATAAGIPQVVIPHVNDQFDTANRLRKQRLARVINAKAIHSHSIVNAIQSLDTDRAAIEYRRLFQTRVQQTSSIELIAEQVIGLAASYLPNRSSSSMSEIEVA